MSKRSPFDFKRMDDQDDQFDQDVDPKSGKRHWFGRKDVDPASDRGMANFSMWGFLFRLGMPLMLIVVWFVVLGFEYGLGSIGNQTLSHWPVVMGNVSHISILKPVSTWVYEFSRQHGDAGFLLKVLTMIASWFVMLVCIGVAGFLHLSVAHLFSNLWLFVLVSFFLWVIKIRGTTIVRLWFEFSCAGIGLIWIGIELAAFVVQFDPGFKDVITVFSHSNYPIVGASVGLMGLTGFVMTQIIRQFRFTFVRGLIMIVMIAISAMLLYTDVQLLQTVNTMRHAGATEFVVELMHLTGFFYGLLRGLQYHQHQVRND